MSKADERYIELIEEVLRSGEWDTNAPVRTKWDDGEFAYTKAILNKQMIFDNGSEIPLLTQKRVPTKDPINEMFWIWRDKSNFVPRLREMGCGVWNEWELDDNTIGNAYGWQLANKKRMVKKTPELLEMIDNGELKVEWRDFPTKHVEVFYLDQVNFLIYTLKTNPYSRRIKTTLWCVEDLDDMALEPCVYETHWQMWGGKLHLTVNIRSNDAGLGNSYNIYQYSILHRLIAQVTGHEVGTICFNIDNFHVYDRHIEPLKEMIKRETYDAPDVWINPDIKSFYDFTINDIKVTNYKHGDKVPLEVAI
ncbi:thymidylate synthase [Niallia taxi]|uniref:thymidylate synthase n=1 Tax=Niallia taxi TaxID=2499688 RepID=UPI00317E5CA8